MFYKINYNKFNGGNKYEFENKVIFFIGPNSPKNILSNLPDDVDYVICVSGNPKFSTDYFNLSKNHIIFTCLKPSSHHKDDLLNYVIDKGIKLRSNKLLYSSFLNGKQNCNNKCSKNITFTHDEIYKRIENELKKIKYSRAWASTGFYCLLDILFQDPKKVYINGVTWFHPKFNIYSDLTYNKSAKSILENGWPDNLNANFKEEYKYLKKNYLLKNNIVLDNNLKWILNNDNLLD